MQNSFQSHTSHEVISVTKRISFLSAVSGPLHPCHYTFVSPWTVETKLRSPQNMDGCGNFSILNKNKFPISEDSRVYSIEVVWIQNFELRKYHAETHKNRTVSIASTWFHHPRLHFETCSLWCSRWNSHDVYYYDYYY